jgi:hypothetical protein
MAERRLFEPERPFTWTVYCADHLERCLAEAEMLKSVAHVGVMHIHEGSSSGQLNYVSGPRPDPKRGTYVYCEPERIERIARLLQMQHGFRVIGYLNGPAWRAAGLDMDDVFNMLVDRYPWWQGIYLDNADVGGWTVTWDFVRRLRMFFGPGGVLIHHGTIEPGLGTSGRRGPWNDLLDGVVIRENLPNPGNDPAEWRNEVSAALWTGAICMPKFIGPPAVSEDDVVRIVSALPSWCCAVRGSWGFWGRMLTDHYVPRWTARRHQLIAEWELTSCGILIPTDWR